MVTIPIWLAALAVIVLTLMAIVVWSVKRRRRPRITITHAGDVVALRQSVSGFTQGTVVTGNRIRLLQNGRFFDALFADIEKAERTINLETFLSKEGEVTHRIGELLARKAAEGVEVRVMLDGTGGRRFGRKALQRMKDAGCDVRKYHPLILSNLGRINNRTHRKIAVIDGRIAYVGGHCLVDAWLGEAQDAAHFRDISARVEGPVVAQVQSSFVENWMEETGEVPAGEGHFPVLDRAGDVEAQAVYISPTGNPSTIKLLHYAAIQTARKRLLIQNPYFLPDTFARDALTDAVRRGVDVRIMVPAASASDAPIVQHASHHHFGTLLKGGVRIFEYERTLLHQKVLVVDGTWASIGSSNFDDRSFELNDEISLVVWDAAVASELESAFEEDLRHCEEQFVDGWQNRSMLHRLKDGTAFLFKDQL